MSKLPKIASNIKCWRILNKLIFTEDCICPTCSHRLCENYKNKYLWCRLCRKKYRFGSYKGSWLYGMKLRPRQLFVLLWCWQNRKSPDTACLLSETSYATVNRWYERFRCNLPDQSDITLSELAQIDESYFGKQKSKQPQTIVTGAIEQNPDANGVKRVVLKITNSRSKEVLEQFVLESIREGALIVSDKWYGYDDLDVLGYSHESWNHSEGKFAGTNQIEGLWSCIKRYLRKLYGCVPTKNLQLILNEWMARHNLSYLFKTPEDYLRECFVPF